MAKYTNTDTSAGGDLVEKVVKIRRCAAVVKGGRRFSFAAMIVVGDRKGRVGWGYGKANEVPPSVEKAVKAGQRNVVQITLDGKTIPHEVHGRFGAARVVLVPASPGTGIVASGGIRIVLDLAGIKDILTKSLGSSNPQNTIRAAVDGLRQLRDADEVCRIRGIALVDLR
ncbi:MAG: 30S ribosomal protein S5 [Planctomycetes bacterium]|nr:30S ribosomal protein S5 [Planctomycetota bacterium]